MKTTFPLLLVLLCSCQPGVSPAPVDDEEEDFAAVVPASLAKAPPQTLSVGSWNLEWFGSTANGPTDEALQRTNITAALLADPIDVWGLSEVVSPQALSQVVAALPGYRAVLATDVPDGNRWYTASEQKVALLYRESAATVVSAQLVATESAFDFGSRPPLEVKLTLASGQPLTVLVLHMKAFGDAASFDRRQRAAVALKAHLDTTLAGQPFAVVGDWNDDVGAYPALGAEFRFVTAALSAAHEHSTVSGSRMIDHHLVSAPFAAHFIEGSAAVEHPTLADYGTTTSDHYPVVGRYQLAQPVRLDEVLANEPGLDRGQERITLKNLGTSDVDLGGWSLGDATAVRHVFPAGTHLAGGATLATLGRDASSGTFSLNNAGDAAVLRDASGVTVDAVSWTTAQPDGVPLKHP